MRLFYDLYSSRRRSEVFLLVTDSLSILGTVFFATAALHGDGSSWDVALLSVWACVPRGLARLLGSTGKTVRNFSSSLLFIALVSTLMLAGWDLLQAVVPRGRPLEPHAIALIYLAWGAGFLLFVPRAYRLHDFLLLGVVIVSLREERPLPFVWVPLFFLGYYLSATVRHLLHDSLAAEKRPLWNLQNARATALLAVAGSSLCFFGTYFALHGSFDFPDRASGGRTRGGRLRTAIIDGEGSIARGSGAGAEAGDGTLESAEASKQTAGGKTIGFSYRIGLRDLTLARFDTRQVLRVKADAQDWRPSHDFLWKAASFSTFDSSLESWVEVTDFETLPWPPGGSLRRSEAPFEGGGPGVRLTQRVINPVFRSIVMPYVTGEVVAPQFTSYRQNSLGDIFPAPEISRGTTYDTFVTPLDPRTLALSGSGSHPDERYLEVPTKAEVGVDLRALAQQIFRGRPDGIGGRLQSLRRYFSGSFRFSNNALWRAGKQPLATFLTQEKVGDCTYYATASAILLRAGGVSTRLAAGFLGGRWEAATQEVVVRNHEAHAWTEVYVPGAGWVPADATTWVPLDRTYQPPPGSFEEFQRLARGLGGPSSQLGLDGAMPGEILPSSSPFDFGEGGSTEQDRLDGSRPEDLAVRDQDPSTQENESMGNDLGSWVQYEGAFIVDDEGASRGGAFVPVAGEGRVSLWGGDVLPTSRPSPKGSGGPDGELRAWHQGYLGLILRALLAATGSIVIYRLIAAFLRPGKAKDEEESPQEPEEGGVQVAPETLAVRFDALNPRDRVLAEYHHLQKSLERTRNHRRPHQTPLEHSRRVARASRELEEAFVDLHRILYRLVYGDETIEERHALVASRSCRVIRRILG